MTISRFRDHAHYAAKKGLPAAAGRTGKVARSFAEAEAMGLFDEGEEWPG